MNAATVRVAKRAYYLRNKARRIAVIREWQQQNPRYADVKRQWTAARRARKASLPTYEVSERDWRRLCQRHDNRCAYCGARSKLTMDHVVPIDRGGQHSIGNLLPACGSCNSSKGPKLLVEWRALRAAA